jgi:hypothetical protein
MHDPQKRLIAREQARPARERVSLEHTLARVFGEYLDDAPALRAARGVPLEVPPRVAEDGVELVADELVGREDAE